MISIFFAYELSVKLYIIVCVMNLSILYYHHDVHSQTQPVSRPSSQTRVAQLTIVDKEKIKFFPLAQVGSPGNSLHSLFTLSINSFLTLTSRRRCQSFIPLSILILVQWAGRVVVDEVFICQQYLRDPSTNGARPHLKLSLLWLPSSLFKNNHRSFPTACPTLLCLPVTYDRFLWGF